jgi:hypothetical protein
MAPVKRQQKAAAKAAARPPMQTTPVPLPRQAQSAPPSPLRFDPPTELEIGNEEPFKSGPLQGTPSAGERVTEHLLDGQQHLTALWRGLHNYCEDRGHCHGNHLAEVNFPPPQQR